MRKKKVTHDYLNIETLVLVFSRIRVNSEVNDLPYFELTYREVIILTLSQQVETATIFAYKVGRGICITATVVHTIER